MENQQPTYDFLYQTYDWPPPGTERDCPFTGIGLQLNPQREKGYNGKPWTCPQCIWFFSEADLKDPDAYKDKDCPYTLREKAAAASAPPDDSPPDE